MLQQDYRQPISISINTYMEGAGDINGEGLLRVKWGCAANNSQRMWKGCYVRKLIKSKSADNNLIVPDVLAIENGMPISEGDNGGDTTSVIISEESDVLFEARIDLPTVNHTEAGNRGNNTKLVKITTTIDAAIKKQCFRVVFRSLFLIKRSRVGVGCHYE